MAARRYGVLSLIIFCSMLLFPSSSLTDVSTNLSRYKSFLNYNGNFSNDTSTSLLTSLNNLTTPASLTVVWSFVPGFSLACFPIGILTNGAVLMSLCFNKRGVSAFNIYLINLLSTNLIYSFLAVPPDIINGLYSGRWWLGSTYCTAYRYASSVLSGGMMYSHVLITVTRLWAMLHPWSYKNQHTRRTAVLLCVLKWSYIHGFILPGLIADRLYYPLSLENEGCDLNVKAQPRWALASQLVIYDLPVVLMVTAYPLIWHKRRQWQKIHNLNKRSEGEGTTNAHVTTTDQLTDKLRPRVVKERSHSFVVLTVLTASVFICWTPLLTYITVDEWTGVSVPYVLHATIMLYTFEQILDPIYFAMTIPDVRSFFHC